MSAVCEECGNHDIHRRVVCDVLVEECGLCGNLQGAPESVQRVLDHRAAEEWGIPVQLWRLIESLESIPGLKVERGPSTGIGDRPLPPAVFFALSERPLVVLDRLTRTLLLATRRTSAVWTIEASHQGRLLFVLRPRLFHPADTLPYREFEGLIRDLDLLHEALIRDRALPWWSLAEDG